MIRKDFHAISENLKIEDQAYGGIIWDRYWQM
jgi:hypothetical protein